eukprot:4761883-Amphidinium_carterae.1
MRADTFSHATTSHLGAISRKCGCKLYAGLAPLQFHRLNHSNRWQMFLNQYHRVQWHHRPSPSV